MKIAVSQMNDNDATLIKVKIVPCIFRIALKQGKEYIVVTGKVINNVFWYLLILKNLPVISLK